MAYNITRSNGDLYSVVNDNIILGPNTPQGLPAPINLVGRNKVQYGAAINENFLWLAENFANDTVPQSSVKGQLFYYTSNEASTYNNDLQAYEGGELLLAPADNLQDKSKWLTVPVISVVQNEPQNSNQGRMIIHKGADLKVFIGDEWKTIDTSKSTEQSAVKALSTLYGVDNFTVEVTNPEWDSVYNNTVPQIVRVRAIPHTGNSWKTVAIYNEGGALTEDSNTVVSGSSGLKYGAAYRWVANIVARDAVNNTLSKSWRLSGGFHVPSLSRQRTLISSMVNTETLFMRPDPRIINDALLGTNYQNKYFKEIMAQEGAVGSWDVRVSPRLNWPNARTPLGTVTAPKDVVNGDYFGLEVQGLTSVNQNLQWNVTFEIVAVPSLNSSLSDLQI